MPAFFIFIGYKMPGYDHGLKIRTMVMGDPTFPGFFGEANCEAIAYGILPRFGNEIEVPFIDFVCEKPDSVSRAFKSFHEWIKKSGGNSDAVRISFVGLKEGGYKVCIYQDQDLLLSRVIPIWAKDDCDPMLMVVTYVKGFHGRSAYDALKRIPNGKSILVCYSGKDQNAKFDEGVLVRKIKVIDEDEVMPNSIESGAIKKEVKEQKPSAKSRYALSDVDAIKQRRWRRLKANFPFTLEYLEINKLFQCNRMLLKKEGYVDWQIIQAACNVVLSYRLSGQCHFSGIDPKELDKNISGYLKSNSETSKTLCVIHKYFDIDTLRRQILMDQKKLLREFIDNSDEATEAEIQVEMSRMGLL